MILVERAAIAGRITQPVGVAFDVVGLIALSVARSTQTGEPAPMPALLDSGIDSRRVIGRSLHSEMPDKGGAVTG
jgi:hypothetical protein